MTDEKRQDGFGQELLTQELVTFEKVHVNVSQTLIITTEDRMNLWLRDLIGRIKKRTEWIAPLGLFISITLALTTTSFNNFVLPSSTWHAVFVIVDIISFLWLLSTLRHLRKPLRIAEEIEQLKIYSPKPSNGAANEGKNNEQK